MKILNYGTIDVSEVLDVNKQVHLMNVLFVIISNF